MPETDLETGSLSFSHVPVMADECLQSLGIRPDGTYVDCTFGGGGHSERILSALLEGGRLIGIDRDEDAIRSAQVKFAGYGDRLTLVHDDFRNVASILEERGIGSVDGALIDLGVSSHQLDTPSRGFSYRFDAPLDMRMDRAQALSAYDVVNGYPEEELRRILWAYGEERYAPRIASAVVRRRAESPIRTTGELSDLIRSVIPAKDREDGHPAKRSFQAIRIEVNGELAAIEPALNALIDVLKPGGRLCVLTFHSLEDRIVKQTFQTAVRGCTCPPDFPVCVCGKKPKIRLVNRKPLTATEEERKINNRSHSAKLRVCEKLDT
ncbi:MAG: 16S rRNA (cytosine(1402)-N(4))-methyltransferase RsmH [Clostridia bacterium]|nr:16S rRNA (cytosine(1402)-N(4))-methyltransferase RsmH [Clostridia bacterium]